MKEQIRTAIETIREAMGRAKLPALLLSGGKESTLLLHLITAGLGSRIFCVCWYEDFKGQESRVKFVKKLALQKGLAVVNWPPLWRSYQATDTGVDIFSGFDLAGALICTGVETVDEEYPEAPCAQRWLRQSPTATFPLCGFDLLFHGGRAEDKHPTLGSIVQAPIQQLRHIEVVYPLYSWTEEQVWEAIRELNAPYDRERYEAGEANIDKVKMCARCLDTSKKGSAWCGFLDREVDYGSWKDIELIN